MIDKEILTLSSSDELYISICPRFLIILHLIVFFTFSLLDLTLLIVFASQSIESLISGTEDELASVEFCGMTEIVAIEGTYESS